MVNVPLLFPTLVVLGVVVVEWRQTRPVAWAALVAGFVLLVAALCHPAFSAEEIVAYGREMLAAPLAVARVVGAFCFLYSVVRLIRTSQIPW
jgi:hypothetical protein